jgi:hypothetical protein
MKNIYVEPQITIVNLTDNDILLFSATGPQASGSGNSFDWNDIIKPN